MEEEKDVMTATDGEKTYVASFSLDERLEKTERKIDTLNKWLMILAICMIAFILAGVAVAYVKWDVILKIIGIMSY